MAKKRLRYIEDLYDFYSNKYKRSTKFTAEKTGEPLVVQVHGRINFDESDKNKDGLLPVHLQSCHTDLNVNGSNIESSVMEAALPSFSNRPILGYIHKVTTDENPEGQWEFYSHNMHEDENGDVVYDEYPIGIIPESCNAQLVYDEEKKHRNRHGCASDGGSALRVRRKQYTGRNRAFCGGAGDFRFGGSRNSGSGGCGRDTGCH